jgi:hypothetical protein
VHGQFFATFTAPGAPYFVAIGISARAVVGVRRAGNRVGLEIRTAR